MTLAITSLALGIPFSAITVAAGKHSAGALVGLTVVLIAIAIINIAHIVGYQFRLHQPPDRR